MSSQGRTRWAKQITLAALAILALPFALSFAVWGAGLDRPRPRALWLRALSGLCLLLYSTLDNVDGKQARKIGAASPLGLVFDHGCDGLAAGLIGALAVQLLGFPALQGCTLALLFCAAFYAKTAEHTATGRLELGRVNAVDEGLPLLALLCAFSAPLARGLQRPAALGLLWGDVAFCALTAGAGAMAWSSAAAVLRARGADWAVEAVCAYALLLACTLLLLTAPAARQRWTLLAFACLHARLTAELIVAHVSGAPPLSCLPYPLGLALAAGGLGLAALLLPKSAARAVGAALQLHALLCLAYLLFFAGSLAARLAGVLGVRVLRVPAAG